MAKLHFHYSTMNAGKSTLLLQAAHNYRERGMATLLMTARLDDRAGAGRITSRIGIGEEAELYDAGSDLFARIAARLDDGPLACAFLDEALFSLSGISTGATRTFTLPNSSSELAILAGTQTLTGNKTLCALGFWGLKLVLSCSIPDDHISPRRSALFMARSVLRDIREGVRPC